MKRVDEIKKRLSENDINYLWRKLKRRIKPSIHINPEMADEDTIPLGSSKLGGRPDLPKNTDWFWESNLGTPLAFICQINFAEAKPYDIENILPSSGILYFFYNNINDTAPWGGDPKDASGKAVYYYDGDLSELERKDPPDDIDTEWCVFPSAKMNLELSFDLPGLDSFALHSLKLTDDAYDDYCMLFDDDEYEAQQFKILGTADASTVYDDRLDCEIVSRGLNSNDTCGWKRKLLRLTNLNRWKMLLQIGNHDDLNMWWGDVGMMTLWIANKDLMKKNFDNTWFIRHA